MKIFVFVAETKHLKKGKWFELPSQALIRYEEKKKAKGKTLCVADVDSEVDVRSLMKKLTLKEWNAFAEALNDLPEIVRQNLDALMDYEPLEEIVETGGKNFNFYKEETMAEVAWKLRDSGEIARFIKESDLTYYMDDDKLGRDVALFHAFFKGKSGMIEFMEG